MGREVGRRERRAHRSVSGDLGARLPTMPERDAPPWPWLPAGAVTPAGVRGSRPALVRGSEAPREPPLADARVPVTATPAPSAATSPTGERIAALDVLRGVAVAGILFANVLVFFGEMFLPPACAAALPTAG